MRKTLVQFALLAIVVVGAYLALFKRDEVIALFNKVKNEAKGYKRAESPEQAMEYFNKAMEKRDYEAAAGYVEGDYGKRLSDNADKAEKLAKAIDDFVYAMDTHNIQKNDKITVLLLAREPFPKRFKVVGAIQKRGEDGAVAAVQTESGVTGKATGATAIMLKRQTDDKGEHSWKLALPLAPDRVRFDNIEKFAGPYVNAIDGVKDRMKRERAAAPDVAKDLQEELEKVDKP